MRSARLSFSLLISTFFVPLAAHAFDPPQADQSDWSNYTWPRHENAPQPFEPYNGTTERYMEVMQDAERMLQNRAAQQAPVQSAPPMPPQQAMAYPPTYQQPRNPVAYPPTYSAQPPQSPSYQNTPLALSRQPAQPIPPYQGQQRYNPEGMMAERTQSQQQFNTDSSEYWNLSFGAGLGYMPKFPGSEDNKLRALPIVDVSYKDTFFINTFMGAGINLYKERGMRAGPYVTLDFGRDSDDSTTLAGAEDVDPAMESGIFFEKNFDPLTVLWTARYAAFGVGHGGVVSDAEISYRRKLQPGFYGTASSSISWASEDYMVSYFGVDAAHAARSGLSAYTPDSGFKDIGVSGNLHYILDDHISFIMNMGFKKLLGDAADSPIVKAGDETQFFGGTGVIYSF